jgi:hypothetical protein
MHEYIFDVIYGIILSMEFMRRYYVRILILQIMEWWMNLSDTGDTLHNHCKHIVVNKYLHLW